MPVIPVASTLAMRALAKPTVRRVLSCFANQEALSLEELRILVPSAADEGVFELKVANLLPPNSESTPFLREQVTRRISTFFLPMFEMTLLAKQDFLCTGRELQALPTEAPLVYNALQQRALAMQTIDLVSNVSFTTVACALQESAHIQLVEACTRRGGMISAEQAGMVLPDFAEDVEMMLDILCQQLMHMEENLYVLNNNHLAIFASLCRTWFGMSDEAIRLLLMHVFLIKS